MLTEDEKYDLREAEKVAILQPLLTDPFLSTLQEAVKVCGYSVDHIESSAFVAWCFAIANKDEPNLDSYDYTEEIK